MVNSANYLSLCLGTAVSYQAAPTTLTTLQVNATLGISHAEISQLNDRALQFYGHSQTTKVNKIVLDDPANQTIAYFYPVLKFVTAQPPQMEQTNQ